jgi:hypothetical protein
MGQHFFYLGVVDNTKSYKPEGGLVFDLPTAYAFFAVDPKRTIQAVGTRARRIVQEWNEEWSQIEVGSKNVYIFCDFDL